MAGKQGRSKIVKPASKFVCTHCRDGRCDNCTDIVRVALNMGEICACDRPEHSGEPNLQQVRDPFSGTVHAPGLTVSEDGVVTKDTKPHG